jgi:hypothetical protein
LRACAHHRARMAGRDIRAELSSSIYEYTPVD